MRHWRVVLTVAFFVVALGLVVIGAVALGTYFGNVATDRRREEERESRPVTERDREKMLEFIAARRFWKKPFTKSHLDDITGRVLSGEAVAVDDQCRVGPPGTVGPRHVVLRPSDLTGYRTEGYRRFDVAARLFDLVSSHRD